MSSPLTNLLRKAQINIYIIADLFLLESAASEHGDGSRVCEGTLGTQPGNTL